MLKVSLGANSLFESSLTARVWRIEFTYGEGGGLEGMREARGLHGEVHGGMRL